MVSRLKYLLGERLADAVIKSSPRAVQDGSKLAWAVRVGNTSKQSGSCGHLSVPLKLLTASHAIDPGKRTSQLEHARKLAHQVTCDRRLLTIDVQDEGLVASVDSQYFAQKVLEAIVSEKQKYGLLGLVHQFHYDKGEICSTPPAQKVVVEYSSPNIAKPFHAGHLRSTILGNFIANINKALGNHVTRINYLGDWGTQFGLLGIAMQRYGDSKELDQYSMLNMYKVYVKINEESQNDESIHQDAMDFFKKMEQGDPEAISFWEKCRDHSIREYSKLYKRLGVEFDTYDGESQYSTRAQDIVEMVKNQGLLEHHRSGVGFISLGNSSGKPLHANLVKSDGTTLYITRDIAAVFDRFKKYNFDRIHYVVENGQHLHFLQLIESLKRLGLDWESRVCGDDFHVKFGRVEGMSTRRGEVVFLEDILDEAKSRMIEQMETTHTTRVSGEEVEAVADRLGTSAVIVQDLRDRRRRNYEFSWKRMLQFTGNTGVFLQYSHARLCSLEERCGVELDVGCSVDCLQEPEAMNLIQHLARFEDEVHRAYTELEPCYIVQYLFQLGHLVGSANEKLRVRDQPQNMAQARLLLFHCSRLTLSNGLKLIGIEPLDKI